MIHGVDEMLATAVRYRFIRSGSSARVGVTIMQWDLYTTSSYEI